MKILVKVNTDLFYHCFSTCGPLVVPRISARSVKMTRQENKLTHTLPLL